MIESRLAASVSESCIAHAGSLSQCHDSVGRLNGTEPSLMLLVTSVLFLLWQNVCCEKGLQSEWSLTHAMYKKSGLLSLSFINLDHSFQICPVTWWLALHKVPWYWHVDKDDARSLVVSLYFQQNVTITHGLSLFAVNHLILKLISPTFHSLEMLFLTETSSYSRAWSVFWCSVLIWPLDAAAALCSGYGLSCPELSLSGSTWSTALNKLHQSVLCSYGFI